MSEQLSEEQKKKLLIKAREAFSNEQYPEAIDLFQTICEQGNLSSSEWQIKRFLIKAYKENGQLEEAIALCEQLANSDNSMASFWAKEFLASLSPVDENTDIPTESVDIPSDVSDENTVKISDVPNESEEIPSNVTTENTEFISQSEQPLDDFNSPENEPVETSSNMKRVMEIYSQAEKEKEDKILPLVVLSVSTLLMIGFFGSKAIFVVIILWIGYLVYSSRK